MRFSLLPLFASLVLAQEARLGDAVPVLSSAKPSAERSASSALNAIPNWYDTSSRSAVLNGYNNDFLSTRNVPLNWTGNLTTGVPGTTSDAYRSAVASSVNWFRAMAGVPAVVTLDASLNSVAQQGALMMAANKAITHDPPTTWTFYTQAGHDALGKSNVCQGFTSDPGCVAQYMADQGSNNYAVGHRRWIVYAPTNVMGTGDVPANGNLWNALYVILSSFPARPSTRDEFVAWPPKGYVPYQMVYPRWSFSYPNADFTGASVTVTRNGVSLPVRQETVYPLPPYYIADNTLVWVVDNRGTNNGDPVELPKPAADTTYSVRIQNVIISGVAREFNYQVIAFDPGSSSTTFSFAPTEASFSAAGDSSAVSLTVSPAGAAWTASSSASWLRITSPTSGNGSAVILYTVDANTGAARSATITVGSATHTVNQAAFAAGCTFGLNLSSRSVSSLGESGSMTLSAVGTNCTWNASSDQSWAQVYPLSGTGGASILYTIFPNYSTQTRQASFTVAGRTVLFTQYGSSGTSDERFVGQIYFNFFGRTATSAEIAFQVQNALQKGVSRANLVMGFYGSEEFNRAGRFVAGLYVGLLNRDAEYGGWLFQRNAFATNIVDQSTLVGNFLNSQEFIQKYGTLTNSAFISLLYRQILGREATAADISFQDSALRAGMTRVQFAVNMLNSAEFRNNSGPRLTAFLLYAALVNRGPSASDLSTRIAQLGAGVPVVSLVQEILDSPEFQNVLR